MAQHLTEAEFARLAAKLRTASRRRANVYVPPASLFSPSTRKAARQDENHVMASEYLRHLAALRRHLLRGR